MRAGKSLL